MCAKIYALANQKGGVGKTTTCINLGVGLVHAGKKVLLVDVDPQGSMTRGLGYEPDQIKKSKSLTNYLSEQTISPIDGILHHAENVDLIPVNIELAGLEISLVNMQRREYILKQYIVKLKDLYDYILLDCPPSLGMLTVNALAASDGVLIPVQTHYLPAKGLEQLVKTISKVKRQINPDLSIVGILATMTDMRTNLSKIIVEALHTAYQDRVRIFSQDIPFSVRAAEASAHGKSVFRYEARGKVAKAYGALAQEVLA